MTTIACQKSDFREDYFFSVRLKNLQYGTVGAKNMFLVQPVRLEIEAKISSRVEQCAAKIRALNKKNI